MLLCRAPTSLCPYSLCPHGWPILSLPVLSYPSTHRGTTALKSVTPTPPRTTRLTAPVARSYLARGLDPRFGVEEGSSERRNKGSIAPAIPHVQQPQREESDRSLGRQDMEGTYP